MKKKPGKRRIKHGLAPGSLVFTGVQKMEGTRITLIQYNESVYQEQELKSIDDLLGLMKDFKGVSWINIDGVHDTKTVELIGGHLGLHKLTMEDVLSIGQRPKIDTYDDYLFIVLKMFMYKENTHDLEDEQISFILKENTLLTFQEKEGDVFTHVRNRIKEGKGWSRKRGADYLLYALVDAVVDHYFLVMETLGEAIENIESDLLSAKDDAILPKIHALRNETLYLRRSVYPLREVVNRLEKSEHPAINPDTKIFIRDLYDHTIQVIESIEVFREMASGLVDLYMNTISNKMNSVMKVLTIIATIFIPLTFVVGIYGMNFENMPELGWRYGYFLILGLMVLIVLLMVIYFRKKKWM